MSAKLEMIVQSFAKDISVTFELSVSLMSHRNKLGLKILDIVQACFIRLSECYKYYMDSNPQPTSLHSEQRSECMSSWNYRYTVLFLDQTLGHTFPLSQSRQ